MVELSINKLTHDIIGAVYEVKRILVIISMKGLTNWL